MEANPSTLVWFNLAKQIWQNQDKKFIWDDWESLKWTVTNEYYSKLCKRIQSKDRAKITVKLEGPTFRKYRRSMRVSFTDKLGSIGGTLGLFSGFSLMAIVELIHWICKVSYSVLLRNRMVVQNPV